jgi:predicted Fe-Mo cluster-binding NifX family protein
MKIAVSATGNDLQAQVDQRFGRCQYFIIYDSETRDFTCLNNESQFASGGAGIQSGQTVQKSGAVVVLTGNVGPNAMKVLQAANIKVFTGVRGTVNSAIQNYLGGKYTETKDATVDTKFGEKK